MSLDAAAKASSAVAPLALQRAWILAHNGHPAVASALAISGASRMLPEVLRRPTGYFAAGHSYVHQGGDGLLIWGDCLSNLGRPADAQYAWDLCKKRNQESESAAQARRRI